MRREEYHALRNAAGLRRRGSRGVIALSGADRHDYLQGLLTNDIAALSPGHGCYATYLTPQGRLVADMDVLDIGDHILLDLDRDVAGAMVDRLEELIFTEEVKVENWTGTRTSYGVDGPTALSVVARALVGIGVERGRGPDVEHLDDHRCLTVTLGDASLVVARTDELGVPGLVLLVDTDALGARVHEALVAAGAVEVDSEAPEVIRVESGRPAFPHDLDTDTIPLEAGIEDRAVSMTKGCYVGQEVIIRILHRGEGRVARRLVGLTIGETGQADVGPVVARGAGLWYQGQKVGRITSVVVSPTLESVIALGYVSREVSEPGSLVQLEAGTERRPAVVTSLPFVPAPAPHPR